MNVCNINIIIMNNTYKSLFLLDPKITYLNHGSFGACPKPIFDSLIAWQKKLELDPVKHLAFDIFDHLENSRNSLSEYIGCNKDDIVFFPNPSTALNTVIRSLGLKIDDEIINNIDTSGLISIAFPSFIVINKKTNNAGKQKMLYSLIWDLIKVFWRII